MTSSQEFGIVPHGVGELASDMLGDAHLLARAVQRLDLQLQVTVQEECYAISLLACIVDYPMPSAAVVARCPPVHRVANVDHKGLLHHGHGDPGLGGRVPDLQASGAFLLQENGDASKVSVIADCRLVREAVEK